MIEFPPGTEVVVGDRVYRARQVAAWRDDQGYDWFRVRMEMYRPEGWVIAEAVQRFGYHVPESATIVEKVLL
jgi:hypothetical protein